jgi:hypothetical protein
MFFAKIVFAPVFRDSLSDKELHNLRFGEKHRKFPQKTFSAVSGRPVYASPPYSGPGCGFDRSLASLIPTANLRHIVLTQDAWASSNPKGCDQP